MEGAVDNKGNSRLSEAEGVERGAPPSRQPSCRDVCNVIAINHGPALARRATSPQTAAGMRQREKKTKGRRGRAQIDFRSHVVAAAAAHSSNSGRALRAQRRFLPFALVVRREGDVTLMLFTGDFARTHARARTQRRITMMNF